MKGTWPWAAITLVFACAVWIVASAQNTDPDGSDDSDEYYAYAFSRLSEASGILVNRETGDVQALVVCEYDLPSAHFCLVPVPQNEDFRSATNLIYTSEASGQP